MAIAGCSRAPWLFSCLLALAPLAPAAARPPSRPDAGRPARPDGAQVFDDIQRIDINDISMVVKNTGSFAYDTQNGAAGFEFPKGSARTAVFAAGTWLGAMVGGQVRVAVSEYTDEFGPGAMIGGVADDPSRPEYKVYKLARSYPTTAERDAALADYDAGAVPHGAPAVTILGDGTLSIPGDQMLWCVFNDADPSRHRNLLGHTLPLGVEVQLTAFAYAPPAGGPADRTVFLHYKFVNKGANALEDLHIGLWSDPDLGGFTDDLVGCDVASGMGYVYNGAAVDDVYGSTPPSVGFDLLRGPLGPGGVPLAMAAFTKYPNGGGPSSALETYNVLRGLNPSGSPMSDPTTGLPTTFAVSGDPVAGTGWLDTAPGDRRMLLSTGPVDLLPGQTQEVSYAIVVGQGTNRLASVQKLRCGDDGIQGFFDGGFAPPPPDEASCPELVNCPRPANYWFQQFAPGGDAFTPAQLAEIAHRVDAASLYLDWSADPVANLRAALDAASATTPLGRAIREFAAFQCNLAVSASPVIRVGSPPIYLDGGTAVSCPGLAATTVGALGSIAVRGLSDASYIDVAPNPPALVGVDSGLPLWGGGAGYAADLFGSSIPSGTNAHSVEIRFTGGPAGQYAYRYLRTLDGSGVRVYQIQDYVPVPFQVWDTDANVQLNAAFLENAGPPASPNMNGQWDPDDSPQGGRELVWAMDSAYSGDATPDPRYLTDPDLQDMLLGHVDLRYVMWPRRTAAGAVIDPGDRFRFTWGGIVPGPGVDVMLFHLAGLPPGDPAAETGYGDIVDCLGAINSGIGIGPTCDVPTATEISLAGTEVATDHVTVRWYVGGTAPSRIHVERRETDAPWASLREVLPDGLGVIEFRDTDVLAGHAYEYRLSVTEGGGIRWLGQVSVIVPLQGVLGLEGFRPNPAGRDVQLAFTLASRAPAMLTVFDLAGRRLFAREVGALGAGRHVVPLDGGGALPSGVYLLQLTQGGRTVTRRAAAIR